MGITPPRLSPDGAVISSCGARFTADRGRFLGASPDHELALLPEGRVLVDGQDKNGLWIVDPARTERLHAPGDNVYQVAVSLDSARVATLETTDAKDARTVVVRALPSLQELRRTPLGVGPYLGDDDKVAFLPDGREVALTSYPCVEEACSTAICPPRRCAQRTLFTFDRGVPAPLAPDLGHIARAAFAPRGDVAAIVREDGTAAVIALPSGRTLSPVPALSGEKGITALAVSDGGTRVAVAAGGVVSVYARDGSTLTELFSDTRTITPALAFSADGHTLFTGDDLVAYGEGATPRPAPAAPFAIKPPVGFERVVERDGDWISPFEGGTIVAMFHDRKYGATVTVIALDPEEYNPASEARAWALEVVERQVGTLGAFNDLKKPNSPHLRAWGEAGARAAEFRYMLGGCDPRDNLSRIQERAGGLWLVKLETAPGLTGKRLAAWQKAFFDEPLGPAPPAKPRGGDANPNGKQQGKNR
jgi:hypothetical protein